MRLWRLGVLRGGGVELCGGGSFAKLVERRGCGYGRSLSWRVELADDVEEPAKGGWLADDGKRTTEALDGACCDGENSMIDAGEESDVRWR